MKNKTYSEFTNDELRIGTDFMFAEMRGLDYKHPIRTLHLLAWNDFKEDKFTYDGATFVPERSKDTIFELAAFIHDWRNSNGYVSKEVDTEFFNVMTALNYDYRLIIKRYYLSRIFTFLNIIRHKYFIKDLQKNNPLNLFKNETIKSYNN